MTTQIAVELPDDLLAAVDRLVGRDGFSSRSDVVRAGLQRLSAEAAWDSVDRAFARGFAELPDSDDGVRRATALAIESIEDEPWEKWW